MPMLSDPLPYNVCDLSGVTLGTDERPFCGETCFASQEGRMTLPTLHPCFCRCLDIDPDAW